jgi:hypothetical protein
MAALIVPLRGREAYYWYAGFMVYLNTGLIDKLPSDLQCFEHSTNNYLLNQLHIV